MERLTESVEEVLRSFGWFPGRIVSHLVAKWREQLEITDKLEMFAAAERTLSEFGGLIVNQEGPGKTCTRESFRLIPTLALHEGDRFAEFSDYLKMKLYPLGDACGGLGFLAIGESGEVFLLMQDIQLLGKNIDEALEHLILGTNDRETR